MNTKFIPFNEKCRRTTAFIAMCAVIALLTCFASETPAAVTAAITFAGDIAVLAMFSLYFAMTAGAFAGEYPERRAAIFCAADCAALVLKIAFAAFCAFGAESGGVFIHAAALIADSIFSRVLMRRSAEHSHLTNNSN